MTPAPNSCNEPRAARIELILLEIGKTDDPHTTLVDLLADAMHWCDRADIDFHRALVQAYRHYFYELNDQQTDERKP